MHKLVKKHGHFLIYEITTSARWGWGGSLSSAFCKSKSALRTSPNFWGNILNVIRIVHTPMLMHVKPSQKSLRKSAVRRARLTSFIAVLLSHHSCNHLLSLWTKRNNSGGRIPVLMEVMLWSSRDKRPIMGRQWTILLAALQNISQTQLCWRCIPLHCPPLCKPLF